MPVSGRVNLLGSGLRDEARGVVIGSGGLCRGGWWGL